MKKTSILISLTCLMLITGCNVTKEPLSNETEEAMVIEESESITESVSERFPEGITEQYAETDAYPDLVQLIIDHYDIPEAYLSKTKYYYNYVDLNDDGKEEIFTVVMGPYTSGTGGSSALIVYPVSDELHVNQDFTLINTPLIISDQMTKGAKEIIAFKSGGGAVSEYVVLTCSDGYYETINEGKSVDSLEGISGTAIIANDLLADMENGTFLTLGQNK